MGDKLWSERVEASSYPLAVHLPSRSSGPSLLFVLAIRVFRQAHRGGREVPIDPQGDLKLPARLLQEWHKRVGKAAAVAQASRLPISADVWNRLAHPGFCPRLCTGCLPVSR